MFKYVIGAILFSFNSFSQDLDGKKLENTSLSAKFIDESTNSPIEYVQLKLYSQKDSILISGIYSDEKGIAYLDKIPFGNYYAKVTFLGYDSKIIDNLKFSNAMQKIDLGVVKLTLLNFTDLGEVKVIGKLEVLKTGIDKKIYNVADDMSSKGGTANDVLNKVPSVGVDQDGNISLRGDGNVTILIDGRPSSFSGGNGKSLLDAIPASSIERIEIVTNPSAKYSPDGTAGIINVVLKKNKLKGTNGMISTSGANGPLFNGSASFSYRNSKFNAYSSYTNRYSDGFRNNYGSLTQIFTNDSTSRLEQNRIGSDLNAGHTFRMGSDFYLPANQTIGFSVTGNIGIRNREGDLENTMFDGNSNLVIENHYSKIHKKEMPMDIEWAKDGKSGDLFILQARPETVHTAKQDSLNESYVLLEKSKVLLKGRAVGLKIGSGRVRIIKDVTELANFKKGEVLVTDMTDPDWEPVMKKAAAIITNRGGRTCHAAIVSREHGVPCLVGTGKATELLTDGQEVTVSCSQGDEGYVYESILKYSKEKIDLTIFNQTHTKVMINLANPNEAFKMSLLPVAGIGLARIEFIINQFIKIHPMALVNFDKLEDVTAKEAILKSIGPYANNPKQFFIDKLTEGIATIAGAFYPRPVIVRFSDFKTNEYANLLGGKNFEPSEENPMLGFRGASRYYHESYRQGFALECQALKNVRENLGLTNVKLMVPFCRTPKEGKLVLDEMAKHGLLQGKNNLEVYVMVELPSNVLNAHEFAEYFDGFSIGSNDLTQMILGVDRDSAILSDLFDERDPAVLQMFSIAIQEAKLSNIPIGICGQAPSDYPEITKFLVENEIDSISVTPDVVFKTIQIVYDAEVAKESHKISLIHESPH